MPVDRTTDINVSLEVEIAESLSLNDSIGRESGGTILVELEVDVSETLSFTGSIASLPNQQISEDIDVSETADRVGVFSRAVSESVSFSIDISSLFEEGGSGEVFSVGINESLSFSDEPLGQSDLNRTAEETLSFSPDIGFNGIFVRNPEESISFSGTLGGGNVLLREMSETVSVSETIIRGNNIGISESWDLLDETAKGEKYIRNLAESLTFTGIAFGHNPNLYDPEIHITINSPIIQVYIDQGEISRLFPSRKAPTITWVTGKSQHI